MTSVHIKRLWKDGVIIVASVIVAVLIMQSGVLDRYILGSDGLYVLNSFVSGLFFTSAFTTAPAIVVLGKLGATHSPLIVALVGGLGALIGDLLIFSFIKSHITDDLMYFLKHSKSGESRRIAHLFKYRFFRWSLGFLGALIIASPIPDEVGLALMGVSRISIGKFALVSFVFNALGILAISFAARAF